MFNHKSILKAQQVNAARGIMDIGFIKAIGFDLFNTLIVAKPNTLKESMNRLIDSLWNTGIKFHKSEFKEAYKKAVIELVGKARETGIETHNKFWITKALSEVGYQLNPDDPEISDAIEAYFSAFFEYCYIIPDTLKTLEILSSSFPLGLLTNFTDPPVAKKLIEEFHLRPFFETIVISGQLGYRKPHPKAFKKLVDSLGVKPDELIYVGDDPGPDIDGALEAGIMAVWLTYTQDHGVRNIPLAFPTDLKRPSRPVPRVNDWQEFLSLFPNLYPA
ncbi:MAG TPA: HAD family hydrolase [Desulfobacterales bacterium]|nr:HAD family hydrolase [Desulfobacterales bacterium]